MLANVGGYFGSSTYYSQRTKSNTGQSAVSFSSTASIHLHMNNPEGGDKAVTSVGFPDGTSASVYSAEGYSQYTVKYWNQNGNISEYNYDADEVDAGNANYLEMLAFTSHLDKTGQTSNAFGDFISAAQGVNGDRTYNSENILSRYDFKQMTEDFMNAQYRFGNMTGYLSVKNLYDHMMSGAFNPGTDSRKTVDDSDRWDDNLLLEKAQSGDTVAARKIIEKNIASGRIQKAMDGNEFIRMQGEIVQKNYEAALKNQKSTRGRLLEQDPDAASKWYMYDNGSKRYTFDEFCEFIDKMEAEQRANAPAYRNQFLEMANHAIQQKNRAGYSGGSNSEIKVSNFKEVETENYKLVPEPGIGGLRILVNGKSAGVFKPEHLKIQEDAQTGTRVMISELPGFNGNWYDAIPVTEELESALSEAMGVDEVPHKVLEGYYIGTHAETGIRYVMRPGDEGKGGQVLLCNAVDEARYKALGEEYARRYPNLVKSPEEGLIYANFEIRGMAHRGANGIVMTHPDNISYNDNSDPKKNWSAMIGENAWNLLLSWFRNHTLDSDKMTGFRYWDGIFNEVGGTYERVWSDDELKQGYLYQ